MPLKEKEMPRFFRNRSVKHATAPGSLIHVGRRHEDFTICSSLQYDASGTHTVAGMASDRPAAEWVDMDRVNWVDLYGLHEPEVVDRYFAYLGLHLLNREDVLNTTQRPKFEDDEDYIFFCFRMLLYDSEAESFDTEQISLVLREGQLFTFQERQGDLFDPIRKRIQNPSTRIRSRGADYLCFALIDLVFDYYLLSVEQFGERIESQVDLSALHHKELHLEIQRLYNQRTELNYLRRSIKPALEMVLQFRKSESPLIQEETRPYLKELEDNIRLAVDSLESYQILLSDKVNHLNSISANRLNEIIRTLTVFSVVFIPLTFLAGVYGTNFNHLPELEFRWAYPIFWSVMLLIAAVMIYYFRRKSWL